jgi:hypothetical protein
LQEIALFFHDERDIDPTEVKTYHEALLGACYDERSKGYRVVPRRFGCDGFGFL